MLNDEIAFERKTIPQAWPDLEKAELMRLRTIEGRDWAEIASQLKRSEAAVKSKFKYLQSEKLRQEPEAEVTRTNVPKDVLAEQARRLSAMARDLTGSLLGDPPLGFSALDRRSAA